MCEEQHLRLTLDENNLFTWTCDKHKRGGLIEYEGKKVIRVRCPPKCWVRKATAQQALDELLRHEEILIAQDRAAGRTPVRPLDQPSTTMSQEEVIMLKGKTPTPETPKNETPTTATETPVTAPASPSFWQRTKEAAKAGYTAIPLKREGTCFGLGMATMYAMQRGAAYYLAHSADVTAAVTEAVVGQISKK
jgi:hypothetical protein